MTTEESLVMESEAIERANLILRVQQVMERLTDDERVVLMNVMFDDYCRHCGSNNPYCQCSNDE